MSVPAIKREESPETSVRSIPPMSAAKPSSKAPFEPASIKHEEDVKHAISTPSFAIAQPHLATAAYCGSSPRKYKINARPIGHFSKSASMPPAFDGLPSRLRSALATARGSRNNITTTITTPTACTLEHLKPPPQPKSTIPDTNKSRHFMADFYYRDFADSLQGQQFPVLRPANRMQDGYDASAMMHHNNNTTDAQNAAEALEHEEYPEQQVLGEMVQFNYNLSDMVAEMNERLTKIEYENEQLRFMITQQGAMFTPQRPTITQHSDAMNAPQSAPVGRNLSWYHYDAEGSPTPVRGHGTKLLPGFSSTKKNKSEKTKARKQLKIKIPGKVAFAPPQTVGFPTPLTRTQSSLATGFPRSALKTASSPHTPKTPTTGKTSAPLTTPMTPGRMGPSSTIKRAMTCINKRKIHNLNEMIPPVYAIIPIVPLTDTEVIIYFFSSLSRPLVALRLYARNWGPAHIVDVLNAHRAIEGGYLRNTCSVKCTTAIKKGRDKYGERWETQYRQAFCEADDVKATDLIHLSKDEVDFQADYDIRALNLGLTKFPDLEHDAGIFTKCVMYCVENDAPYTLANVWELADDLTNGRDPVHPSSPAGSELLGRSERRRRARMEALDRADRDKYVESGFLDQDGEVVGDVPRTPEMVALDLMGEGGRPMACASPPVEDA